MSRYSDISTILCLVTLMLGGLGAGTVRADVAVVVHPDNPVASLDTEAVKRIFLGRQRMFPDTRISVEAVDQDENSKPFLAFYAILADMTPDKLRRLRASYLFSGKGRVPRILADDIAVLDHVAAEKEAIGYVSSERVDQRVKTVLLLREEKQ